MEPIAHARSRQEHESSAQRLGTEFVGAAGWPAQPKLVPVEITCEYGSRWREEGFAGGTTAATFKEQRSEPAAG